MTMYLTSTARGYMSESLCMHREEERKRSKARV